MNTLLSVSLILMSLSVIFAAVIHVITLIKIKAIAVRLEEVIEFLNNELRSLKGISKSLGYIASPVVKFLPGILGTVLGWIFFRKKKNKV